MQTRSWQQMIDAASHLAEGIRIIQALAPTDLQNCHITLFRDDLRTVIANLIPHHNAVGLLSGALRHEIGRRGQTEPSLALSPPINPGAWQQMINAASHLAEGMRIMQALSAADLEKCYAHLSRADLRDQMASRVPGSEGVGLIAGAIHQEAVRRYQTEPLRKLARQITPNSPPSLLAVEQAAAPLQALRTGYGIFDLGQRGETFDQYVQRIVIGPRANVTQGTTANAHDLTVAMNGHLERYGQGILNLLSKAMAPRLTAPRAAPLS
jgi:hypothetical protein